MTCPTASSQPEHIVVVELQVHTLQLATLHEFSFPTHTHVDTLIPNHPLAPEPTAEKLSGMSGYRIIIVVFLVQDGHTHARLTMDTPMHSVDAQAPARRGSTASDSNIWSTSALQLAATDARVLLLLLTFVAAQAARKLTTVSRLTKVEKLCPARAVPSTIGSRIRTLARSPPS